MYFYISLVPKAYFVYTIHTISSGSRNLDMLPAIPQTSSMLPYHFGKGLPNLNLNTGFNRAFTLYIITPMNSQCVPIITGYTRLHHSTLAGGSRLYLKLSLGLINPQAHYYPVVARSPYPIILPRLAVVVRVAMLLDSGLRGFAQDCL